MPELIFVLIVDSAARTHNVTVLRSSALLHRAVPQPDGRWAQQLLAELDVPEGTVVPVADAKATVSATDRTPDWDLIASKLALVPRDHESFAMQLSLPPYKALLLETPPGSPPDNSLLLSRVPRVSREAVVSEVWSLLIESGAD